MPDGDETAQQSSPASRDMRFITAETLAIATALGYSFAFLYQTGFVGYYEVPLETIRVSPEWVIFIGIALVPGILGMLSGATAVEWLATSAPERRKALRLVLLLAGLAFDAAAAVIGSGRWASFTMVVSIAVLSLALGDWLDEKRERRRKRRGSRFYAVALLVTALALAVIFGISLLGYRAAATKDTYLVDEQNGRVLVYATDAVYVFAAYDPKNAQLQPTLTYLGAGNLVEGGMTLVSRRTGRLKSAAPSQ